ncbi:MAG TPA: LuxR C-terminal-related transcriptional regulator [Bacillota bacterium]|nr:LuxR C-terminal-related transcriptional regulator [Bacillota bacterium]
MDYISVRAAAENWGISERRVQKLCEEGRVPGAQRFGRCWMLPGDAQKPEDQRLTPRKEKLKGECSSRPGDSNPLSMLREAWELKAHGFNKEFNALLDKLLTLVKARQDEPELYGEWLLLSSFKHHPHLSKMIAVLKEAAPYFQGKCSRVILPSSLFPFASLGVFSIYHTEPGNAQEEARLLDEFIPLYASLTGGHGTGADISYRAEMLFYCGDLSTSEILAHKALYMAREKKQTAIVLTSALLLGHIALCKGDADGWQRAIDAMFLANKNSRTAFIQNMIDAMRGILLLELTHPDNIADWLKTGDFERLRPMPQLLSFAHFVHAQYLCRKGEFARLIGFAEVRYPKGIKTSPILDALLALTVATAYMNMGDKDRADMFIQHAADRMLPDGLIFPLGSYIQLLGGLLDPILKKSYPSCLPAFLKLKSQLNLAGRRLNPYIVTIVETVGLPDDLTLKEREVALLAAQGLRNTEIAQRLAVTENTVRYHLRSVFSKLDVDRRMKLAEKLL